MKRKSIILFLLLWLIVMLCASIFMFKQKTIVSEKGIQIIENEKVDVVVDGKKLSLRSFKTPVVNLGWIDGETIKLEGIKTSNSETKTYSFNVLNQTMNIVENDEISLLKQNYELIAKTLQNQYIYTDKNKPKSIMLLDGDKETVIVEDAFYEDSIKYNLSKNNNRIVFYDANSQKIKILNLKTMKITNLNIFPDEIILRNFDKTFKFSPDLGYIILDYYVPNNIQESYFSVYGADSGKLYSDKIWGLNPCWSPTQLKVGYIYGDKSGVISTEEKTAYNHGKRIGYYNLKTRKSEYIGNILNEVEVVGDIKWTNKGTMLGYHTGYLNEVDNKWCLTRFNTYNIETKTFTYFDILLEDLNIGNIYKWDFNDKYYVVGKKKDDEFELMIHKDSVNEDFIIQPVQVISEDNQEVIYQLTDNEVIYKKDNVVFKTDLMKHNALGTYDENILSARFSDDKNYYVIISSKKGNAIVDIVNINESVPVQ